MTVCRFFLQGTCKFGGKSLHFTLTSAVKYTDEFIHQDHCKNEHPGKNTAATRNPFAPFQNGLTSNVSSSSIRSKYGASLLGFWILDFESS